MRNLKRALSLGLASAMVLGTMTFGTNAASFNDIDQVVNEKAVELVAKIGLMMGDDEGNFNPNEVVNRAEMAVICTTMLHGANFHVSQFVEVDAFTDVPAWAADYVNLAASLGIVEGRGDGTFDPNSTVTTAEAMTMILRTLGYLQNSSEFGDNWALNVTRKGTELGLYNEDEDGVLSANEGLTRENVASLAFRALTDVVQVDYNPTFQAYYNYGSSMVDGVNNNVTEDTLGYKNFEKLFAYDSKDAHDRPSVTWMHNGQEIGTYAVTADFTFTEQKTVKEIYNCIGGTILASEDYTRGIYVDGELLSGTYTSENFDELGNPIIITSDTSTIAGMGEMLTSNDTTPFLETGAGVLTEIYLIAPEYDSNKNITKQGEVIISLVHTYLAEVTYVTDNGDDNTVGVRYYTKDQKNITQNAWVDSTFEYSVDTTKAFEKGEMVMLTVAENAKGDMEIVTINKPDTVEGTATGSRIEPNVKGGSWVEIDGETYDYALSVRGNIDDDTAMAPIESSEIVAFFDDYGYVLGYSATVPGIKYLYVEDKDEAALMGGSRIRATLADGSEKVINVTYIDDTPVSASNWAGIPSTSIFTDTNNHQASANENFRNDYTSVTEDGVAYDDFGKYLENRIYGYVELSDGTYKLTTDIRKQYNPDGDYGTSTTKTSSGVLPGILVNGNDYTYETATENNIYGLPITTKSTLVATPQENTMFIFSSVHYDRPTDEKSDWNNEDQIVTANYSTRLDKETAEIITIYNENGNRANHYTFGIQKGYAGVLAAPSTSKLPDPIVQDSVLTQSGKEENYFNISDNLDNASSSNHVFVVDTQTVYVDVVNNAIWTGYDDADLVNMLDGDVNMQVVFGKGGVADVVYINHGAPQLDGEGYFIVTDNQADWKLVDGVDTYTYTVWVDGVAEQIVVKDHELTDQNGDKLNNNDLYRIEAEDDDYVYRVNRLYEYDLFANVAYSENYSHENAFNSPVSAATYAAHGTMLMAQDERIDNVGGNTTSAFNPGTNNDGGVQFLDEWVYDLGVGGEDAFSYDDDTTFIVLSANGSTSRDNSAKYSVRVGDASDIQVTGQDYVYPSWVDVIEAKNNNDKSTPYAQTVVVIQPYVTSETFFSGFEFHIEAHDTYLEPTLGMTADELEIENWLAWKANGNSFVDLEDVNGNALGNGDGTGVYGYDSQSGQWNWQKKAFYTDGTTMEKAFVLEGWVDTGSADMADVEQSWLAKEIMLYFATELRNFQDAVIEEFVTGGSTDSELYGSWNAKVSGIDAITGDAVYTYVRVPFAKQLEYGIGYYETSTGNKLWSNFSELGFGAIYTDWTAHIYANLSGKVEFTSPVSYKTGTITGSLNMDSYIFNNYANETALAEDIFRLWASEMVKVEKITSNDFDYVHVVMLPNEDATDKTQGTYNGFVEGEEFTAYFYYFKDGKHVQITPTGYLSSYTIDFNTKTATGDFALLEVAGSGGSTTAPEDESTASDYTFDDKQSTVELADNAGGNGAAGSWINLQGMMPASDFAASPYNNNYQTLAKEIFTNYVQLKTNSNVISEVEIVNVVLDTEGSVTGVGTHKGYVQYYTTNSQGVQSSTLQTVYLSVAISQDTDDAPTNDYFEIYDTVRPESNYLDKDLNEDLLDLSYFVGAGFLDKDALDNTSILVNANLKDLAMNTIINLTGSMLATDLTKNLASSGDDDFAKALAQSYMEDAYANCKVTFVEMSPDGQLNTTAYEFKFTVMDSSYETLPVIVNIDLRSADEPVEGAFTITTACLGEISVAKDKIEDLDYSFIKEMTTKTAVVTFSNAKVNEVAAASAGIVNIAGSFEGATDSDYTTFVAQADEYKKLIIQEAINEAFPGIDYDLDGAVATAAYGLSWGGYAVTVTAAVNARANSEMSPSVYDICSQDVVFTHPITGSEHTVTFKITLAENTGGATDFVITTALPTEAPTEVDKKVEAPSELSSYATVSDMTLSGTYTAGTGDSVATMAVTGSATLADGTGTEKEVALDIFNAAANGIFDDYTADEITADDLTTTSSAAKTVDAGFTGEWFAMMTFRRISDGTFFQVEFSVNFGDASGEFEVTKTDTSEFDAFDLTKGLKNLETAIDSDDTLDIGDLTITYKDLAELVSGIVDVTSVNVDIYNSNRVLIEQSSDAETFAKDDYIFVRLSCGSADPTDLIKITLTSTKITFTLDGQEVTIDTDSGADGKQTLAGVLADVATRAGGGNYVIYSDDGSDFSVATVKESEGKINGLDVGGKTSVTHGMVIHTNVLKVIAPTVVADAPVNTSMNPTIVIDSVDIKDSAGNTASVLATISDDKYVAADSEMTVTVAFESGFADAGGGYGKDAAKGLLKFAVANSTLKGTIILATLNGSGDPAANNGDFALAAGDMSDVEVAANSSLTTGSVVATYVFESDVDLDPTFSYLNSSAK